MRSLVTITEAARLLGVSRQRVFQLVKGGELKAETISASGRARFVYLIRRAAITQRLWKQTRRRS